MSVSMELGVGCSVHIHGCPVGGGLQTHPTLRSRRPVLFSAAPDGNGRSGRWTVGMLQGFVMSCPFRIRATWEDGHDLWFLLVVFM